MNEEYNEILEDFKYYLGAGKDVAPLAIAHDLDEQELSLYEKIAASEIKNSAPAMKNNTYVPSVQEKMFERLNQQYPGEYTKERISRAFGETVIPNEIANDDRIGPEEKFDLAVINKHRHPDNQMTVDRYLKSKQLDGRYRR